MATDPALRALIRDVRRGRARSRELLEAVARRPFDNLGFARVDTHRSLRRGVPEAVFCEGKTAVQIARIARRLGGRGHALLLTRMSPGMFEEVRRSVAALRYDPVARLAYRAPRRARPPRGLVAVVTGGTSDLHVAEEAAVTLGVLGSRAARLYDVGVAGLHRVIHAWPLLRRAKAIIVVAGMEGALASVVAGLVSSPVVAVPTSVGYGANFEGLSALLTMLNSCVPGVGVVNIDNGFGAAYLAHVINAGSA
ncbi:MAG TPA: nickel pincer cofactor biosynthesis protein LarB [bacterium]